MSVHLTPLPAERFAAWKTMTRASIIRRNRASGMRIGADAVAFADRFVAELLPDGLATPTTRILSIVDDGRELGTIWLGVNGERVFLIDLSIREELAGGQRDELFSSIADFAREHGAEKISIGLFPQDAAARGLIEGRGFEVASIQMILEPIPERDDAARIDVVPMTAERYTDYAEHSVAAFAEDLAASGRYSGDEAVAESRRQFAAELPDGVASEGQELFTASVDGVEVGILWIGMRRRDGRPHAFILDVEVVEDQRRKGYGRELMHAAEREARRLGAGSMGLHVFGFNTGAIDLYERLGYRRVEESLALAL
ncbi:GNAT family N-acetyltransferase [Microbacterium sp. SD291]|uniref:GNAT family N-acetyltransferase n=1 Tax=Microbacterium sp. SD291 TaxID=2782007 RepID=UPI001A95A787|nr:GNAT family N-acetyltransferase [Microbacterium sp. SD291]MBO0982003.1 GNAT family N-acetyltransferase [Microbacterium sp. SD291]